MLAKVSMYRDDECTKLNRFAYPCWMSLTRIQSFNYIITVEYYTVEYRLSDIQISLDSVFYLNTNGTEK